MLYTLPLEKRSTILTLPLSTRLLSNPKLLPLLSQISKGKSLRGHHLVITGRASIILIILRRRGRGMLWRGWRSKANHASLFAGNATDLGVHRTHLICEIVKTTTKVSLHSLKLHHDGLKGHTTSCGGRRSWGRRWNSKSCKIGHLHLWLLQSKLSLTPLDKTSADGTHDGEKRRERNENVKVCEDTHDSRREGELITCSSVLIHIYDRCDEVKG